MKIGILCIGDELLKGAVINTNLAYMGQRLLELGTMPLLCMEMPDTPLDVVRTLDFALQSCDFVITSGGLGPTADDLTKQAIADYLHLELELDEACEKAVRNRWNSLKRGDLPLNFLNQALIPHGAKPLSNRCGSAPGIYIRTEKNKQIAMLPGPPSELHVMFDEQLLPILKENLTEKIYTKLFHISGVPESRVEERCIPILQSHEGLSAAYCASPEFVKLFLRTESPECLESAMTCVRKEFEKELLHEGCSSAAAEVVYLLKEHGKTLSLAESCTGGLISRLITDVPGASEVYMGGVVSYANSAKEELLGVRGETLKQYGAVSEECAAEMVKGAADRFHTSCAISVTGIAGPGGGTESKPVGTVCIGIRYQEIQWVRTFHFTGSREQIRNRTCAVALNTLRRMFNGETDL